MMLEEHAEYSGPGAEEQELSDLHCHEVSNEGSWNLSIDHRYGCMLSSDKPSFVRSCSCGLPVRARTQRFEVSQTEEVVSLQ